MNLFRAALYIASEDVSRLLRVRETLVWAFVMPVVFFYFIGTITSNITGAADSKQFLAVDSSPGAGMLADELLRRFKSAGYTVERVPVEAGRYLRRLEIPAGFTDAALAGKPLKLRFTRGEGGLGDEYDRARISRVIQTLIVDAGLLKRDGLAPTPESFQELARERGALSLDVAMAGKRVDPPWGYDQSVPGTMVMFTMLVLFTVGAVSLTMERDTGILRRLASAPISRGAVVLGKWGARMAIGAVQIAFAMIAGTLLFHVHWGPNLPVVVLVLLSYAALVTALGMLLGNFGRSTSVVTGIGVIVSNVLAGLGGCWWPIEITPLWAQKLAIFLPTGWTMDALHKLINFGASPAAVIPHIRVTLAATLIVGYVLSRRFRFQ